jgi:hypothetical protein
MILDGMQSRHDSNHQRIARYVQLAAQGVDGLRRRDVERVFIHEIRNDHDARTRHLLDRSQRLTNLYAVAQHAMSQTEREAIGHHVRDSYRRSPSLAGDQPVCSRIPSPHHAEEIGISVVRMDHIDLLVLQEAREAKALAHHADAI